MRAEHGIELFDGGFLDHTARWRAPGVCGQAVWRFVPSLKLDHGGSPLPSTVLWGGAARASSAPAIATFPISSVLAHGPCHVSRAFRWRFQGGSAWPPGGNLLWKGRSCLPRCVLVPSGFLSSSTALQADHRVTAGGADEQSVPGDLQPPLRASARHFKDGPPRRLNLLQGAARQ